jgi:hypothetical protein
MLEDFMKAWSRSSALLLFLICMIGLCSICFLPLPAAAQEGLDVSSQVAVTFSGLRFNRATNTFDTIASLTNTSTTPMATPISLVLTTIDPSTVTVANASGQTSSGKPFLNVPVADGTLDPGETIGNMVIKFRNPNRVSFTFQHSVLSAEVRPVATVRTALHALTGVPVILDGSDSYDPNGRELTFYWSLLEAPAGSTAVLTDAERPNPRLTPDIPGVYLVELIVNNGQTDSLPAQMTLTAFSGNVPPNARAGRDQHARLGLAVPLDGRGSDDPNHTPLDFLWSFVSVPSGSARTNADISTPDSPTPLFVPDVAGTYVLNLRVNDGVNTDDDTVQVLASAPNVPPNAYAGVDVVVQVGEEAVLDGRGSVDPDAGPSPLSFAWTFVARPAGSTLTTAALQGAATATPRFTRMYRGPISCACRSAMGH